MQLDNEIMLFKKQCCIYILRENKCIYSIHLHNIYLSFDHLDKNNGCGLSELKKITYDGHDFSLYWKEIKSYIVLVLCTLNAEI